MSIEITKQLKIQSNPNGYYTIDDYNIDVGAYGITLSYYETGRRISYITLNDDEALVIAQQIINCLRSRDKSTI